MRGFIQIQTSISILFLSISLSRPLTFYLFFFLNSENGILSYGYIHIHFAYRFDEHELYGS